MRGSGAVSYGVGAIEAVLNGAGSGTVAVASACAGAITRSVVTARGAGDGASGDAAPASTEAT
jgi:hypothetical protein